jgi:4-diphosphocytidyl-2-C-methyl-D-erythritol kinase
MQVKAPMSENPYLHKNIDFPCPAKINLFLHIVGQRADGYHELETAFQFLDYADTITLKITNKCEVNLLTPLKGVNNEDNLIIKAARLLHSEMLKNKGFCSFGVDISLNKILPMGGGLGGGSSNAATILVALNKLWQCDFLPEKLAELGLSLGADVPVFIHGFSAFAQGVGEQLKPISPDECWYLITKPKCSISTKDVFNAKNLTRNTPKISSEYYNTQGFANDLASDLFHNDCQSLVIKDYPEVANLLAWLVEYAPSRMTGTGACIFSRFTSQQQAVNLQMKLPSETFSFVAKGVNISPLSTVINSL